ncbi:MAG: GNAT family N-acetyltransferase [Bacillati bacterium]
MRVLHAEGLRLEPVLPRNAAVLWGVLKEPGLREYQELPAVSAAEFAHMVEQRERRLDAESLGRFEWLIYPTGATQPVGWVSLRIPSGALRAGEIGYTLLPQARGRGYATRAVRALLAEAQAVAVLAEIRAYCVPENQASRRVLERIGFRKTDLLRHGATVAGRAVDVVVYAYTSSGKSNQTSARRKPA